MEGARLNFLLRGSGETGSVRDRLENSPGRHLSLGCSGPGVWHGRKPRPPSSRHQERGQGCGKGWSNSSLKNEKEKTARGGRYRGLTFCQKRADFLARSCDLLL